MGRLKLITLPLMFVALLAVLLAMGWPMSAAAQGTIDVSDQDCSSILASYAEDPKSVAKPLVDACEQALLVAPAAGSNQSNVAAASDPCTGDAAGASVQCWGPWAAPLAPLAGPNPPGPVPLDPFEEPRPELLALGVDDGDTDPDPDLDFPITPCEAGLPCGFATVVAGDGGTDTAANTQFASIDLAADGSSFTITGDGVDIQSGTDLNTQYSARPDNFENLRAGRATIIGILTGQPSELIARALRDGDGDLQISGDFWSHDENGTANSGYYAWGRTLEQADIDSLIAGDAVLSFSGPMSVDNATIASITLNYGATSTWNGSWNNPAYNFSAGGGVAGANFLSDATQFSDNVQDGFVQGALVGDGGTRAITHIIEVTLDNVGLVRDVGLLTDPTPLP